MKGTLFFVAFTLSATVAQAQNFSSGSTGADGALDLTSGDQTLQLPESGIFNFTTINVPAGSTLRFLLNTSNTPVVLLAQGNVTVGGVIDVSGRNEAPNFQRTPGPGGFFGGFRGGNGFGPGGGQIGGTTSGRWVGPLTLVPIIGGSGGAGTDCSVGGLVGTGGGGAIVIASSTSIVLTGVILAQPNQGSCFNGTASGSGGAIRLVANSVNISGYLSAYGNFFNWGVVRVEAAQGALTFTGSSAPQAVLSTINPMVGLPATPTLRLVSIGGFPIPAGSGARADTVDLLLPAQLADPIPLVVEASNIPVGSQVSVLVANNSGSATPGTLTGTDQSSTATLSISGLNRTGASFLFASVIFEVPALAQADNPAGPNQIARLRVDAVPGKESKVAFLRSDGTEIDSGKVPQRIRQLFGQ